MDKSSLDLMVKMRHLEIHNRTEGKSARRVGWYEGYVQTMATITTVRKSDFLLGPPDSFGLFAFL